MASLAYIQVTRKCNQRCRFCSNPPNKRSISLEEGQKLIDFYIEEGYEGVIFTGGEPTLSPILPDLIKYACKRGFPNRIITNGQKLADMEYLKILKDAGLSNINVSFYSFKKDVQAFLTKKEDSLTNIILALENLGKIGGISVNVNTVINHYNADHLFENVKWIVENFPFVRHFVWNNLDPLMNRARRHPDTIPKLNEFELSLQKAMQFLESKGKTFRLERIPLCYLKGYEHLLNETRKLVKGEERLTFFLDKRGLLREKEWGQKYGYGKADCCKVCFLNTICPGLYQIDRYYSSKELHPVFVDKKKIIERILNNDD